MKFQTPTIGGVRKVIRTDNNVTVGTTIAEVGSNTITLAQLAQIITQIQSQQQNNGGGNVGGGAEASIVLGPGLSGGGVLVGNVPIRLTAPIPWGLDDGGGGGDGDPGPPGAAGAAGVAGTPGNPGAPGPAGAAIFLEAEPGEDGLWAIPGPVGPQGVMGSQGPAGTGSGGNGTGIMGFLLPEENWPDDIANNNPSSLAFLTVIGTETLKGNLVFDNAANRNITFTGTNPAIQAAAAGGALLQIQTTGSIQLGTNNAQNVVVNSNGQTQFSGTITGGQQVFISPGAANQTGLLIEAGNANSNSNTIWKNIAGTSQFMEVYGDGSLTVGVASVAAMGTGTVNVSGGYFLNGKPIIQGGNATPAGVAHGMIVDDNFGDDQGFLVPVPTNAGPLNINGVLTANNLVTINLPNLPVATGFQVNAVNNATNALVFNGVSGTIGPTMAFSLDTGTNTKGFIGVTSKVNETVPTATTGTLFLRVENNTLVMSANAGVTAHVVLTSAGITTFSGSIGIKGVTPAVTAGQTDIGITTTATVITTAGGIALPALASTFWKVNVNGVAYGIPCFAL